MIWRRFVKLFFLMMLLEGTFRKILPGQPVWVLVVKDIFLLGAYIFYFMDRIVLNKSFFPALFSRKIHNEFFLILFLYFLFSLFIASVLTGLENIILTILAVRQYLFYFPAIYLGYSYFRNVESQINKIAYSYGLVIWLAGAVALIQICSLQFGFVIPKYLSILEAHSKYHSSFFGPIFYCSSIFDVPERFGAFSFYMFLIWIGIFLSYSKRNTLALLSSAISFFCILASARRTPIILALLYCIVLFMVAIRTRRKALLISTLGIAALFLIVCCLFDLPLKFALSTPADELRNRFRYNLEIGDILSKNFLGNGFSVLSQGAQYIAASNEICAKKPVLFEGWREGIIAKAGYELGLPGLIAYLSWLGYITFLLLGRCLAAGGKTKFFIYSLFMFWVGILLWSLKGAQIFGDGMTSFLFWFSAGIILSLGNQKNYDKRIS